MPQTQNTWLDHDTLAETLLEIVYEERRCITTLNLEEMGLWAQKRQDLTHTAIELGQDQAIPEDVAYDYRHVHEMTRENLAMLQDAHHAVSQMLHQMVGEKPQTYTAQGETHATNTPRGVLVWKA